MTFALKKFRSPASYGALILFFYLVYRTVGETHFRYLFYVMAGFFVVLIIQHTTKVNIFAFPIYALLATIILNYIKASQTILSVGLADMVFPLLLPFFPLVVIHYLLNVRQKKIPGSGAVGIMALGFLWSATYQTIVNRGVYVYGMHTDWMFSLAFVFSCIVYMLLAVGILSIWPVVKILTLSMLPEIVYILFLYIKTGSLNTIFASRLGYTVEVSATLVSCWLDFTFPFALFIAINEKKKLSKYFFAFLAVLYGSCQLMTATRGSFFGLLLLPIFFVATAKSRAATITVLLVTVVASGLFGRAMLMRTFLPNKVDILTAVARKELIKSGFLLLKDNYFTFGIGMDNYKTEKFRYGFMSGFDPGAGMSTHNSFMEFWLGWGLLGIIGWLYLLIGLCARAVRARLPSEIRPLVPALVIALTMSSIHGLFDSMIANLPYLVYLLSVIACLSFVCSKDTRKDTPQCRPDEISSRSTPQWVPFSNKEGLSNG